MNKDLTHVHGWFNCNKLRIKLGEDKAKCILFANKYRRKRLTI